MKLTVLRRVQIVVVYYCVIVCAMPWQAVTVIFSALREKLN